MRAPTTSWWWNVTPCGPIAARPRLAHVVQERGEPHLQRAATSWRRPRSCARARPCARWIGSCSSRIALSSGRNSSREPRVARSARARPTDRRRRSSFDSSSRMRSALMICEPIAHRRRSPRPARGVGLEAERRDEARRRAACAADRRRTRSRATSGVRSRRVDEVGEAAERIDELGLVERDRHRVHREVAAREIGLDVVGERHLGLAAVGAVDVGAERRDLEPLAALLRTDRPEALALQPHRVGPARDDRARSRRARVGRDVDVEPRSRRSRNASRTRAADEVRADARRRAAAPRAAGSASPARRSAPDAAGQRSRPLILRGRGPTRRRLIRRAGRRDQPRPRPAPTPGASCTARSSAGGRAGWSTPRSPRAAR